MKDFVCAVGERAIGEVFLAACEGLPEYQGTRYCVLHYPGEDKKDDFKEILENKLARKDYDFSGTIFPEGTADFHNFVFDADASFYEATFVGRTSFYETQFVGEYTNFYGAEFSGELTDFTDARFDTDIIAFSRVKFGANHTYFLRAKFGGELTVFSGAEFSGEETNFVRAEFGSAETQFEYATFMGEVRFGGAAFKDKVAFLGTEAEAVFASRAWAWFNYSRIEKPELLTFNSVLLHPGGFINTDIRKVDFTDVKWYGMPGGPEGTLDKEIDALKQRGIESPHTLLAQACRRLSANAEENREYPLANEFHYWSMNALRKQGWRSLGLIGTLYWALSGYGVSAARAFLVLVAVWAGFTTLYVLVDPPEFEDFGQGIGHLWQAAVYSLLALARLNPAPSPLEPGLFQFLVGLEGTLGPLQIALFALAVRRKVMR